MNNQEPELTELILKLFLIDFKIDEVLTYRGGIKGAVLRKGCFNFSLNYLDGVVTVDSDCYFFISEELQIVKEYGFKILVFKEY